GRPRNPRVWFATPKDVFDDAARAVTFASTFEPKVVNGVAAPCPMHMMVSFGFEGRGNFEDPEIKKSFGAVKPLALAGDPTSQAAYGILLATRTELNPRGEPFLPWI